MNCLERAQHDCEVRARGVTSHARQASVCPARPDSDISAPAEKSRSFHETRLNWDGSVFAALRARLLRIAHRMLGSHGDAEDLVQDVYLRWHQSSRDDIESPTAFLVTVTTRLCLDRLRELKRRRSDRSDACFSEDLVEDRMPSPEMQLEFSEDVSMAFLAVLERLGAEEKTAFLLHDVLDCGYHEIGRMLGKTESACRQTIHRARRRLRDSRVRFAITPEWRERAFATFLGAIRTDDRQAMMALLDEAEPQPHRG